MLVAATLATSIGAGPLNPIIVAGQFERIPADMRGRVFGAITAGAWLAPCIKCQQAHSVV